MVTSRTDVASVGSVFNDTRKVKVLSLPETMKEKSTFRAKALRRELVVKGLRSKRRFFLYRFSIVTRDMVWKLGELQSVYNELQFNVETASPCTNLLKFC